MNNLAHMLLFDRYLLRNLAVSTLFIAICLAMVILLTQSLRFLELIINSGASSFSFLVLSLLALPRFFEVILPIALMIGILFTYNRMNADSEVVVMRAAGFSPWRLSRAALLLAGLTTLIVFIITSWLAPLALSKMQAMRISIKAEYSSLLLREGVFNPVGKSLTVYVHERSPNGDLTGLLIHDTRDTAQPPLTLMARRGVVVMDGESQKVVVYDGTRQQYDPDTGALSRLDFERYTLDIPDGGPVRQRWREPDERTLPELLYPEEDVRRDAKQNREFMVEVHRRVASPFLAITYSILALVCLMLGTHERRGHSWRIMLACILVILIQGLYLMAYNLAKEHLSGLVLMYALVFTPLCAGCYFLSAQSETVRLAMLRKMEAWA